MQMPVSRISLFITALYAISLAGFVVFVQQHYKSRILERSLPATSTSKPIASLSHTKYKSPYVVKKDIVNIGDVIHLSIKSGNKNQTSQYPVDESGTLFISKIGEIEAAGLQASDILNHVTPLFQHIYSDAEISILIEKKIPPNSVFVIGEIQKPGLYSPEKSLDIEEAIAMAGGLTAFANPSKLTIFRRENGIEVTIEYDLALAQSNPSIQRHIKLNTADVLIVH